MKIGRMGHAEYARILAAVFDEARTHEDVAELMDRQPVSIKDAMWKMAHMGLLHVVEWRKPRSGRSWLAAAFRFGPGESAPYPRKTTKPVPGAVMVETHRPELVAFVSIARALLAGATRAQIKEQSGVAHHRINLLIAVMRKELGIVRVSEWLYREDWQGNRIQVLQFGRGRDAKRLPTMDEGERAKQRRQRRQVHIATQRALGALHGLGAVPKFGVQNYRIAAINEQDERAAA